MKLNIKDLKSEYNEKEATLNILLGQVKYVLQQEINRQKIKIHSFPYRVKPFDSFLDKIHRKNIKNPFKEIHDLAGLRIVCLFLSDIELIGKFIQKEFDVLEEDNKIDGKELNLFGYMSKHYKAKLKKSINTEKYKEIKDIPFEIQVRTIGQDAWASISHHLDYKQNTSFPDQLKRDFYALSGLFYVADTHFSILRKEQQNLLFKNMKTKKP